MIDFHSHILPRMDDGSRSVQESLSLLNALHWQNVENVVATSHYYASQESPERFLGRRQRAFEALSEQLPDNSVPRILLGAEVLYYPGISRMKELGALCTQGTNILLLEMPFSRWTDHMVRELDELARSGEYSLLLAHIERYYSRQPAAVWDRLLDQGVLMQANADYFLAFRTRRMAFRLLRENRIHLLGSDCHNMSSRAPHMNEAADRIRKALGEKKIREIEELSCDLLSAVL